jgi:hypothetical protein
VGVSFFIKTYRIDLETIKNTNYMKGTELVNEATGGVPMNQEAMLYAYHAESLAAAAQS